MPIDILLFAAIAVFFVWKLRQTLGTRNGEERERPNPFTRPPETGETPDNKLDDANIIDGEAHEVTPENRRPAIAYAPSSLAGGLTQLRTIDPSFDEKKFLAASKQAFTMIIEAFAKPDVPTLELLLSADVFEGFKREIARRAESGEVMVTDVRRIVSADISAVRTEGKDAFVTVDFTSEQITYIKNLNGEITDGDSTQPLEISESWTFQRDTSKSDPNWHLVATRHL